MSDGVQDQRANDRLCSATPSTIIGLDNAASTVNTAPAVVDVELPTASVALPATIAVGRCDANRGTPCSTNRRTLSDAQTRDQGSRHSTAGGAEPGPAQAVP
ncbi:hypothetical protein ACFSGX_05865 [Sphingomonas arantia]|uniref:Uncharacterized protein n=1 Tax=Sphingomonas arantia TaxID=1460676 RepID=A0ABW4TWZ4_9SPHN